MKILLNKLAKIKYKINNNNKILQMLLKKNNQVII